MKIRFTGFLLLVSLFLLSACGQKGPLYLKQEPVAAAPAAELEKDASLEKETEAADKDVKPESKE
jgi:predicted small lipoprotein YifL